MSKLGLLAKVRVAWHVLSNVKLLLSAVPKNGEFR